MAPEGRRRQGRSLPRRFYARDARTVAPELLNKVLVHGKRRGRIVEVEAYIGGGLDPGSHADRGLTSRNAVMFGPPGLLYVYFTYGMHWCCNAVCGAVDVAGAVLIRAVAPLTGVDEMQGLRLLARREVDLTNGPAKLCQAFAIDGAANGADLVRPGPGGVTIVDDGTPPPAVPGQSTRIGLSAGAELPWRWFVSDDRFVSKGRVDLLRSPAPEVTPGEFGNEVAT